MSSYWQWPGSLAALQAQINRRLGLAAMLKQAGEFGIEGLYFSRVDLQPTLRQLYRTVSGLIAQLRASFRQSRLRIFGLHSWAMPLRCSSSSHAGAGACPVSPQPGMAAAGKYHAPVTIAKGAFGTGSEQAACLGHQGGNRCWLPRPFCNRISSALTREPPGDLRDGLLCVIGLAGDQQALDRLVSFRDLRTDGPLLRIFVFKSGSTLAPLYRLAGARRCAG
ncbi:MAG: hypothetical protein ACFWUJ_07085 [Pseudomonas fragi]